MRKALQFFSAVTMAIALIVAVFSLGSFVNDKGRAAKASEEKGDAAKEWERAIQANVPDSIGRMDLDRAEQEERTAEADAASDSLALGLSIAILLIAGGVWLLGSIAASVARWSGPTREEAGRVAEADTGPTLVSSTG